MITIRSIHRAVGKVAISHFGASVCNKQVISFSSSSSSSPSQFLSQIKIITLDVTGTLLTFRKPPFQIYAEFGRRSGLKFDEELMKSSFKAEWKRMNKEQPHFGRSWQEWWIQFVVGTFQGAMTKGSSDEATLRKVAYNLIQHFSSLNCWKLKPGASELISSLRSSIQNPSTQLAHLGIISNFDPRLHSLLKLFEKENTFSPIILSHEHQISKPSPKIFNLALKEFPVKPGEALHVGDNYELDYLGAINAGWRACLIDENSQNPSKHPRSINPAGDGSGEPQQETIFPDLRTFHHFLAEQGMNLAELRSSTNLKRSHSSTAFLNF